MNLRQPANEGIVRYLERPGHAAGRPDIRAPRDARRDYWESGAHPDIVERLWDQLGRDLPVACRQVVLGAPALLHPGTGVVFAIALGTQYALRLPASALQSGPPGVRTVNVWSNGSRMDIRQAFGADWVFGAWSADELTWCAQAVQPDAPVEIAPYDPAWPGLFEEEKTTLERALSAWLVGPIEHIGSTAIPGLAAKPVIDIMAGVGSLETSRPALAVLPALGYCYAPYRTDIEHWFCKPSFAFRTHHLHLMPVDGPEWQGTLAFRDYLRAHPPIAAEYGSLKERLAREFRLDREAYTQAKGPFITRITALALQTSSRIYRR